jgi:hypothetical protein
MNLRPLVLGVSLLAGAAPVALAQQMAPPELDGSDLGFTAAQMADFAGQPDVVYAAAPAPVQPGFMPGQQPYAVPIVGQPDISQLQQPQTLMMGYQTPSPGAPPPLQQPANPQQMLTAPPAAIAPNWLNANFPQPMMPGPPDALGYGPACGPPGADSLAPGAPCGVDPYNGACPNGLAAGCNPSRPAWYLRGDSIWMQRSRTDNHDLTSYDNLNNTSDPLNGHFLLSTDYVTYPLEPGTRVTLGRYLTDTWMIEATYLGAINWDRRNGTPDFPTGANGLGPLLPYWGPSIGPFDTSAFTGSNVQIASYESQFNSLELGVRHSIWGTTSILAGFRYINVGDLFQLAAFDDSANTNSNANGFYRTWTNNNLAGFQLGTEYSHDLWFPRLFGSIDCRGGVYANFAEQKNLLFNSGDTYDQRSDRQVQFASVFDLTFALSYLATDHLTIRGGYTFLYLSGIALAPDQLDTNPTTLSSRNFIADNDTLTLQGPFVGGELVW